MKFKLMTYNVQDLFLQTAFPIKPEYLLRLSDEHWAMLGEADQALKSVGQLEVLAHIILNDDRIVCLYEVGSRSVLSNVPAAGEEASIDLCCCVLVTWRVGRSGSYLVALEHRQYGPVENCRRSSADRP